MRISNLSSADFRQHIRRQNVRRHRRGDAFPMEVELLTYP